MTTVGTAGTLANDGTVVWSGWKDNGGYVVELEHQDGMRSTCNRVTMNLPRTRARSDAIGNRVDPP
jgi:hypothetical protein